MLYNIRYWWFFLFQGNQWAKYLAHPKIWRPKPCLLMFASLVALDGFRLLLSTQLTANLTPEWSSGSMFHPLSHIYAKTPFSCIETVLNNTDSSMHCWFWWTVSKHSTHFEYSFLIDKCSCKMVNTLLLLSSTPLLSQASSIYNQPKRVCGVFWCFPGQLPNLDDLSIQHHLYLYDRV